MGGWVPEWVAKPRSVRDMGYCVSTSDINDK